MDSLRLEGVVKRFGDHTVIDGLSFSVPKDSVFGFIGPNGSGKTTTMKMVLGLLRADGGHISVFGETVCFGQNKLARRIGYLPDVPEFYGYLRPAEYLKLCGEIAGLPGAQIKDRSRELLGLVGLAGYNRKIRGFSRGMKQRLGIAQALFNRPDLLICDEPTSALDPIGRKEILDILRQAAGQTTVVFSTHILADVERICDRIAVIDKGRLVLEGTLQELKARHRTQGLTIEFADEDSRERFLAAPRAQPFLSGVQRDGLSAVIPGHNQDELTSSVVAALYESGVNPLRLEVMEPSIESLFLEVVQ